jgi:WD40 repeat protein
MRCWAIVIGLLLPFATVAVGQETKRAPIPSKDEQARIEKLLQELYAKDLAMAEKDPVARGRLAQQLLFEGKETKNDLAGRYVLFSKAHQMAAQAGDVATALAAADELAREFLIPAADVFQMKIKMLKQASRVEGATPESYRSVADRALLTLDDTLEADDYPSSLELIAAAKEAARRLQSLAVYEAMSKREGEVVRLQKEFARWQPLADRLAKNPADAEANLEMGKYHALIKGNWERGLPMMAQGPKSALQQLAKSDAGGPTTPEGRRVVALGWYMFGTAKSTDPALKTQALLRAHYWYQENLANAGDDQRMLIESKLLEIADLLPAEYRIGELTGELKRIDAYSGPVYGCAFAPDGKRFLATGYDGALRLYNTRTFKELRQLEGHAGKAWTVAFSADGKHAASGGFDSTVRYWDLASGNGKIFDGHKDYVRSVALSADGKWILSGSDDRTVRLWNVQTGKLERSLPGHDHTVWCVAISRDGKRGLSASLDKTVRLWDLVTGEPLKKLEGHTDTVLAVAFAPDGRHAVTGGTDKTLRLWDLDTGKTIRTFEGSKGYVQSVAFSPDGRRILSGGADKMVRLWDAHTGKEIRALEGHRDQIWHVAFSRDGRLAISSGQDNCLRLWAGSR